MSDDSGETNAEPSIPHGIDPRTIMARAARDVGFAFYIASLERPEMPILYINDTAANILGWQPQEMLGQSVWKYLHPRDAGEVQARAEGARQGRAEYGITEIHLTHKDGHVVYVELSAAEALVEGRRFAAGFMRDISDRREAQLALATSEARFRMLVENSPDGVTVLRGTTLVFANPVAAFLLGFERPDDLVGLDITHLIHPSDREPAQRRIEQVATTGRPHPTPREYRSRDLDGRERVVEISSIPTEHEGEPAILGFARDVTDRIALQSRLLQTDRLAAVGLLAAGVAHEVNNPLTHVLLNVENLLQTLPIYVPDDGQRADMEERLEEVREGAERVATIVRDLTTFARAGRDPESGEAVDVPMVIESALHYAQPELGAITGITRDFSSVPLVRGNRARLGQVFLNLLVNAAHAVEDAPSDRRAIHIRLAPAEDGMVLIEISDSGAGIAAENLDRIFDPFFTTKDIGRGTGLGLAICRGIVESLGGRIDVSSERERGTTFTLALPPHPDADPGAAAALPPRPSQASPQRVGRILIIDDEPLVARSFADLLTDFHEVAVATNADDALGLIRGDAAFDLVFCDLVMPGVSGNELYERMRAERPELGERTIFMTGGAFTPEATEFVRTTDCRILEKPLDILEVQELIAAFLNSAPD